MTCEHNLDKEECWLCLRLKAREKAKARNDIAEKRRKIVAVSKKHGGA